MAAHPFPGRSQPRAERHATSGAARPRAGSAGFSLVELLVVFTITALVAALVVQGLGFFGARFDGLRRLEAETAQRALPRNWFGTTVAGVVPYRIDRRRFVGDAAAFRAFTTTSLANDPALPVQVSWRIDRDPASSVVTYREEGGLEWPVLTTPAPAAFQYADAALVWHAAWPVPARPFEHIPTLIRLVTADGETVWLGRPRPHPEAVPHPDDFS